MSVEVDLVLAPIELCTGLELVSDVGDADERAEGHEPVVVRDDAVEDRAGREHVRVADEARDTVRAFPVAVLLAAEWRRPGVGPGVGVRAVVGGVLDELWSVFFCVEREREEFRKGEKRARG